MISISGVINNEEDLIIFSEDQYWDKDTLAQLREEYNIFFMTNGNGVVPIMVKDDLIIFGNEDDGMIHINKNHAIHYGWIPYLIADLEAAVGTIEHKEN